MLATQAHPALLTATAELVVLDAGTAAPRAHHDVLLFEIQRQIELAPRQRMILAHHHDQMVSDHLSMQHAFGNRQQHIEHDAVDLVVGAVVGEDANLFPWLAKPVLDSGTLPLLGGDTPVLLGVFVSDSLESRTVEVKVHGQDWPQSQDVFKDVPAEPDGAITMLRELAVLVPQGPALPLSRATLERTFQGLTQAHRSTPRPMLAWPGWRAHQGALLSPMPEADVHAMESELGPLPPDYRRFLVEVAAGGAGPGYGLLAPMGQGQQRLARGQFTWRDSEEPRTPPEGCVALAYAGCGVMWLLVISGPNRGEVWVDAVGSDRVARRVARSFDAFYRAWLDAALRNSTTFAQWNALRCATPNVLTHVLDDLEGQGIRGDAAMRELARKVTPQSLLLRSAPTPYFYDQELMGPCLPCVLLVERLGLSQDVFVDGIPPLQGRPLPPPPEGMLARWARKLGKREA